MKFCDEFCYFENSANKKNSFKMLFFNTTYNIANMDEYVMINSV